jgi:tRNA A-37 threonylcarbamoyl transferase component Bud32
VLKSHQADRIALTSIILQVITMNPWIYPKWQPLLLQQGLGSFDQIWEFEAEFVESPNVGRGGHSGVALVELVGEDGGIERLYLKRQANHLTHGLGPLQRFPTARREFKNLMALRGQGFSVPDVIFFGERRVGRDWQAILLTRELYGKISLWDLLQQNEGDARAKWEFRRGLITQVADLVRRLHDLGYRHGALYPKHLFVNCDKPGDAISLIDLEKMRKTPFRRRAQLMDLDALNRRTTWFSRTDRLRYLCRYLSAEANAPIVRQWWRALTRRALARQNKSS